MLQSRRKKLDDCVLNVKENRKFKTEEGYKFDVKENHSRVDVKITPPDKMNMTSAKTGKLYAALSKAQAEFPIINKNAENKFFGNKYVTLDHLINKTAAVLSKYGLAICQQIRSNENDLTLRTVLALGDTEEWVASEMPIRRKMLKRIDRENKSMVELNPQEKGSEITYAQRYSYSAIIGVAASADDDGEDANQASRDNLTKKVAMIGQKDLQRLSKEIGEDERVLNMILSGFAIKKLADLPENKFDQAVKVVRNATKPRRI